MGNRTSRSSQETKNVNVEPALRDESSGCRTAAGASASSPSVYHSPRIAHMMQSRSAFNSVVEFEIESSRSHWSQVVPTSDLHGSDDETEYSPEVNLEHFEELKKHPQWGKFFKACHLGVGEKIAEGGQADIYEAGERYVVKVFKEGYPLRSLQRQWPEGMSACFTVPRIAAVPGHTCCIWGATILEDERLKNRFAFAMERRWGDLRKLIDIRMQGNQNQGPPFPIWQVVKLMHDVAEQMVGLLRYNIVHRDLKASNVLVCDYRAQNITTCPDGDITLCVVDFECSVGVMGTGFWRAPEILQQQKDKVSSQNFDFTTKADVYSYGMTCYEIATGLTPFEGQSIQIDDVLSGRRPALPDDLDPIVEDIIISCWQLDPSKRPDFDDIYDKLTASLVK